jgi:hypothetical protein
MVSKSERYETLIRRKRETLQIIAAMDAGEHWHPMTEAEYRLHLNATLGDIDEEIEELEADVE